MKPNMRYFDFLVIDKDDKIIYKNDFEASPYLEFSEFLLVTCNMPKNINNDKFKVEIITPYKKYELSDKEILYTLDKIGITNGTLIRLREKK